MMKDKILEEIKSERIHQDSKWGGEWNDDHHSLSEWISYINVFLGKAALSFYKDRGLIRKTSLRDFRYFLIKVAAVSIAAIEYADRLLEKEDGQ